MRILLLLLLCLASCEPSKKYKMANLVNGDDIDVTKLITKKGYKPFYCGTPKVICALINPLPPLLEQEHEILLKKEFEKWLFKNNIDFNVIRLREISIVSNSNYQYSYIINSNPIDVFKTEIMIENTTINAYFRMDNGHFLFPYDKDGWVIY